MKDTSDLGTTESGPSASETTCKRRQYPCKNRLLFLLLFVLLILCIVLASILLFRSVKQDISDKVCTTKECVVIAYEILEATDPSVEPCNDFYKFACNKWNEINSIPEHKSSFGPFDSLHDSIQFKLKVLLEKAEDSEDTISTNKSKLLYRSCMNTVAIEKEDDRPIQRMIDAMGGWPMLKPWTDVQRDEWNLEEVLNKASQMFDADVFFKTTMNVDDRNSSVYILYINQPELSMATIDYYPNPVHKEGYLKFMVEVANLLGVDKTTALERMNNVFDLEYLLCNITTPPSKRNDNELYQKITFSQLKSNAAQINWDKYYTLFFSTEISDSEEFVTYAFDYIVSMATIVTSQDKDLLGDYIIWRIIFKYYMELPLKYKNAIKSFRKMLLGISEEEERWQKCVELANENLGMAVGRLFVKDNFNDDVKDMVTEMIDKIRKEFVLILEDASWMDKETKIVAIEKALAIVERIGYPEYILNSTDLDSRVQDLNITDNYYENLFNIARYTHRNNIRRGQMLFKRWEQTPAVANAFYNPNTNEIIFPAGIFQPNFYNLHFPKALNYGGIGVVIGHEITHGFDNQGRQFDKDGNNRLWWDNATISSFVNRTKCFVQQYSQQKLEQLDLNIDGYLTLGENVADNGGLKAAYKAYHSWIKEHGEEPRLPGVNLTNNQLFFLNYARSWCGLMRDENAISYLRTSNHSPGPTRVIVPLHNSLEFSESYGCPLGSPMNPIHKCSVW